MKLEVHALGQARLVEIRNSEAGSGHTLEITLTAPASDSADPSNSARRMSLKVLSRTQDRFTVELEGRIEDLLIFRQGGQVFVNWRHHTVPVDVFDPRDRYLKDGPGSESAGRATLKALMPGKVIALLKREGDPVEAGEGVVVIEAMKMQNEVKSPKTGRVVHCPLQEGQLVAAGALICEIE